MSNDGLSESEKVNLLFKNYMNFTSTLNDKQFFEETAFSNNSNIFSENILSSLPSKSPVFSSVGDVTTLNSLLVSAGITDVNIDATWFTDKTADGGTFQKDASSTILRLENVKLDYVSNGGASFVCYDKNGVNLLQNLIPSNYAASGYSLALYYKYNGSLKPIGWLASRAELAGAGFVGASVNFGGALFDAKNGIVTFYDVNGDPTSVFSSAEFYLTATKYIGPTGISSLQSLNVTESVAFNDSLAVTGDATFQQDISVNSNMNVGGTSTLNGDVSIGGSISEVSNIDATGEVSVGGDATFQQDVSINSNLSIGGSISDVSNIDATGNVSIGGSITNVTDISATGNFNLDGDITMAGGNLVVVGDISATQNLYANTIYEGSVPLSTTYATNTSVDTNINTLNTLISDVDTSINTIRTTQTANKTEVDASLSYIRSNYSTTSYVDTKVSELVSSAPEALDTLNELAFALGDDASFSTTILTKIGSTDSSVNTIRTATETNAAGIVSVNTRVNVNDTSINSLQTSVDANTTQTATNTTNISNNSSSISTLDTRVNIADVSINTLETDVATNTTNIADNKTVMDASFTAIRTYVDTSLNANYHTKTYIDTSINAIRSDITANYHTKTYIDDSLNIGSGLVDDNITFSIMCDIVVV